MGGRDERDHKQHQIVYIYDFSQFPTTVTGPEIGPSMNMAREQFGCGTLENGAIVVSGGPTRQVVNGDSRTNTVEILLPGATSWKMGKCSII